MNSEFKLFRHMYTKLVYRHIAEVNLPKIGKNILYQSMNITPIFICPYQKWLTNTDAIYNNNLIHPSGLYHNKIYKFPFEEIPTEMCIQLISEFMNYSIEFPNHKNNIVIHTESLNLYELRLNKNGNYGFWDF